MSRPFAKEGATKALHVPYIDSLSSDTYKKNMITSFYTLFEIIFIIFFIFPSRWVITWLTSRPRLSLYTARRYRTYFRMSLSFYSHIRRTCSWIDVGCTGQSRVQPLSELSVLSNEKSLLLICRVKKENTNLSIHIHPLSHLEKVVQVQQRQLSSSILMTKHSKV